VEFVVARARCPCHIHNRAPFAKGRRYDPFRIAMPMFQWNSAALGLESRQGWNFSRRIVQQPDLLVRVKFVDTGGDYPLTRRETAGDRNLVVILKRAKRDRL